MYTYTTSPFKCISSNFYLFLHDCQHQTRKSPQRLGLKTAGVSTNQKADTNNSNLQASQLDTRAGSGLGTATGELLVMKIVCATVWTGCSCVMIRLVSVINGTINCACDNHDHFPWTLLMPQLTSDIYFRNNC